MGQIVRQKSLRRQVYDAVREDLRQGRIGSDALLVEREVAQALGVSRTPVREALYALEQDGFVQSTARGFKPKRLDDVEVSQIFEMRQLLEPHALASVARSSGDGLHAALSSALAQQQKAHEAGKAVAFMKGNQAFRDAWMDRLANPRLASAIALYDDHIHSLRLNTLDDPAVRQTVLRSLSAVLDAVMSGDMALIKRRYRQHLSKAETVLRAQLADT